MSLVTTGWLYNNLNKVKILDSSWHLPTQNRNALEEYSNEHIVNSIFFDIEENCKCIWFAIPLMLNSKYDKVNSQTNKPEGILELEKPCEVLFEGLDLDKYYKKPTSSKTSILKDVKEDFCFLYTLYCVYVTNSFNKFQT